MIRVNLLRDLGAVGSADVVDESGLTPKELQTQAALRLVVLFLPVGLLFAWEKLNLGQLEEQRRAEQGKLQAIESQVASLGDAAQLDQEFDRRTKEVSERVKAITDLDEKRLVLVKALDGLQSILPRDTWFEAIQFEGSKITVAGISLIDSGPSDLARDMKSSPFFFDVNLQDITSTSFGKDSVPAKRFQIKGDLTRK
jgi:Tfp pilus assembly protein PilN